MVPRILIVAESIDVEDSSGTKGRVALIKNLKAIGCDLSVFHYTRKKINLEGIDTFAIEENRSGLLFLLSRLERQIRYKFKLKFNPYIEKLTGFSFTLLNDRNSISKCINKVPVSNYDLVITFSKGGSFRPHHALLQLPMWHRKWLAYIHDPYPMHHYPKPYTWREPGYQKKEDFIREVSEKATWSAFPSLLLKEWMGKFYPHFLKSGVVIPHQIFNVNTEGVELPDFFNSANFNLLHAGTLLGARNPTWLIKAFRQFLLERPEAKEHSKLLFIGGKDPRLSIEEDENIFVSDGYIQFDRVTKMQKETSVNIILEARSDISPFLPGKFPHSLTANKPILVLGPEKSEVRRLLGETYPNWAKIDDISRIERIIQSLYFDWKNKKKFKLSNREDLERYLGPEYLKEVLNSLTSKE